MNKKVILFLNGEPPKVTPDLTLYQKIYCTDGAYDYLVQLGIQPDVISGDLDSFHHNLNDLEIKIIHTPDQEFTDFEKALQLIVEDDFKDVDVFGASGKQQDHFIGNLNAAFKFKDHLDINFYDDYSFYKLLPYHYKIDNIKDKTISLIPFPFAKGITTKGLKYALNDEELDITSRIGTRNKAIENNVVIDYKEGTLIVFIIK